MQLLCFQYYKPPRRRQRPAPLPASRPPGQWKSGCLLEGANDDPWVLAYRFSPRLADIGGARLWRVERGADYGSIRQALTQPRRYRARTKGKVENGVKYVKRNFLTGHAFIDQFNFDEELTGQSEPQSRPAGGNPDARDGARWTQRRAARPARALAGRARGAPSDGMARRARAGVMTGPRRARGRCPLCPGAVRPLRLSSSLRGRA